MPTLSLPTSNNRLEQARPPVTISSTLILRRAPVETPDALQEAEYRHGGPSEFDISETNPRDKSDGTSISVVSNPDDPEEGPPQGLVLKWQEHRPSRKEVTVTIHAQGNEDISFKEALTTEMFFIAPPEEIAMWAKATGVKYDAIIHQLVIDRSKDGVDQ